MSTPPADYLYLIDAHSQIHRFFHAPFPPLSARHCGACDGSGNGDSGPCKVCQGTRKEPTKATYAFTNQLIAITAHAKRPGYLAVCWDSRRERLIRRQIDKNYKANRPEGAADLKWQLERCRDVSWALGVCNIEVNGYEADDLIATLATRCASDEVHVRIVSRDKDLYALLVDPRVKFLDPTTGEETGAEACGKKWGILPRQVADYLTLIGDSGDNVKGVAGIGPKTAALLLKHYGDLDGLYKGRESIKTITNKRVGTLICAAFADQTIDRARTLIRLRTDVKIRLKPNELECRPPDLKRAKEIFGQLDFRKWG